MVNKVLSSVRDLLPKIAARAQKVDDSRKISERTIRELSEAGVFSMLAPKRYGGAESDPVHFYEVVRAISAACGSTGWVASVVGVHPWHLALFDDQAQADVWGEDQTTLISSAYAPV
ncbi:acyl-CoA dehydrogenase family protein, partial [Rhodococcus erythropolis]|nr:acyl-CoA dehydrogenase family protein [Rhodococcus erythropolis]